MKNVVRTISGVAILINFGLYGFGYSIRNSDIQWLAIVNVFLLGLAFLDFKEKDNE